MPEWWYVIIFGQCLFLDSVHVSTHWALVAMFVFGVVTIEVWNTQMPVWAFVLALVSCPESRGSLHAEARESALLSSTSFL